MKTWIKVVVIAATASGIAIEAITSLNLTQVVHAETAVAPTIPVSLPLTADVMLKDGTSLSGRVSYWDAQGQSLKLTNGNDTKLIKLGQIRESVKFRQQALVYNSRGESIIRGENDSVALSSTWSGLPVNAFHLTDPDRGQAQVSLAGMLKSSQIRGIQAVAKQNVYVVEEIQVLPSGKINLKVIPK